MYASFVPHLLLPLFDRLTGRQVWAEVQRLRALQWQPAEQLEARALAQLRRLVEHAATNVPYYRRRFAEAGVGPADLRSLADLAHFPIASKAELRQGFPEQVVAANLPASRRIPRRTSGSTGTPFQLFSDRAELDRYLGTFLFFFQEWAGAPLWYTRVRVVGEAAWPTGQHGLPNALGRLQRLLTGERTVVLKGHRLRLDELRNVIRRQGGRPYYLWGQASYLAALAAELLESGVRLADDPRVVICSAEALTGANAAVIARGFRCRVINHYSTWELPHIAQSCPDNPDLLHVNPERAVLRIVRPDGSDAAPGEQGRVVLSHLRNRVMPLINYDLGDWARAESACGCGRGFPCISGLEGRLGESIRTADGRRISPTTICNLLTVVLPVHGYVAEFQAVQRALDVVVLRVVPTAGYNAAFARQLEAQLANLLGPGTRVVIEQIERVEHEASGKRLLIKSEPRADPDVTR